MVDFDGDCMADLFLTVQDVSTGRKYYEIYLRREFSESMPIHQTTTTTNISASGTNQTTTSSSTSEINGLGSFCLVSREAVPDNIGNMFYFTDIDRDGMVDMFYVNP